MTYQRFEDLPVWQAAVRLARRVFELTEHPAFRAQGDLANQLQRAALSVSNNIAEGFERMSVGELLQFLYYAKGSAGEARSMLHVMRGMARFKPLQAEVDALLEQTDSIARQLGAWAASQRDGAFTGRRQLSANESATKDQRQRATAFLAKLKEQTAAAQRRRQRIADSESQIPDNQP